MILTVGAGRHVRFRRGRPAGQEDKMIRQIILAPDSFKGTMTANEVCAILEKQANHALHGVAVTRLPLSDGGEGLVDCLVNATGGTQVQARTVDPFFRPIDAVYGILPDKTAVIEMAAASGLPRLAPSERNPWLSTSYGTGLLLADALARGCRKIILGLGGSATVDGGIGAAAALGFRFFSDDAELKPIGSSLGDIRHVDLTGVLPSLRQAAISIACDVTNPLCGPNGAAYVFGPQKGADPAMVEKLDRGLANLAAVLEREHHFNPCPVPGTGAAGGLAIPFLLLGRASIQSGLDLVLDQIDFASHLARCDLVITGEGRTDAQSAMGKVLSGVSRRASQAGKPVIAISGSIERGSEALYAAGITALFATVRHIDTLDAALAAARESLAEAASDIFRLIAALDKPEL
jgi:glycerate 2-kinase